MGLGRFGGGVGITRWLVQAGAQVLLTDQAQGDTLASSLDQLTDLIETQRLQVVHGPHDPALLDDADVLVVNPAVPCPWDNSFIQSASSQGIEITTEIEISYRQLQSGRVIAITGSAGKSTTGAMIHHILNATGHHALLGGNIGGSLLDRLDTVTDDTIIVLEISSAMIYWLWGRDRDTPMVQAPAVACITNYSPNHIDWHGRESHYRESKKRLLSILPEQSTALLGPTLHSWESLTDASTLLIKESDAITKCAVPGKHNAINAAMAVQAADVFTQANSNEPLAQAVRTFTGLPHRLNRCHRANGIIFYNDSKSTVPEATILAVDAIAEHTRRDQIHLIAGGSDKGSDVSSIAALHDQLAGLYTIGATGQSVAQGSNAHYCDTLENALELTFKNAKPGDAILLSPGCASWDQFNNYEQRGDRFVSLANKVSQSPSCSSNS